MLTVTTVGIGGSGGGGGDWYWVRDGSVGVFQRDMNKPPYRVPLMSELKNIPWNGRNVVSTFSGCGGSSLGYKLAGYKVLWANEFIPAAQETYAANHPATILDKRDIRQVQASEILDAIGLQVGDLDLFDGSPPCKDFSMAGARDWESGTVKKYSDTEQRTDDLFFQYVRLLRGLQPKTFVAENVAGMTVGKAKDFLGTGQSDMFAGQSFRDKEGLETIIRAEQETVLGQLRDAGYTVTYRVLNAAQLGVPQARRRIIFIGVRNDIAEAGDLAPAFPEPFPYTYSIRDAIPWIAGTLPAPRGTLGVVETESDITKYCTGAEWEKIQPGEASEKYFMLVKPKPDEPCPTICASHGSGGIASVVHPFEKRKFSIAELKRVCAFPDDFILTGSYAKQWERLGRAVPPLMMKAIASTVRSKILSKIKRPNYDEL